MKDATEAAVQNVSLKVQTLKLNMSADALQRQTDSQEHRGKIVCLHIHTRESNDCEYLQMNFYILKMYSDGRNVISIFSNQPLDFR